MIRQIFIAPLKDGLPEEKIRERINAQLALKDHVPGMRACSMKTEIKEINGYALS